jgi:hypothetical protein
MFEKNILQGQALSFLLLLLLVPQTFTQSFAKKLDVVDPQPTIEVEKRKYQANEEVLFNGSGFASYEQVTIIIREINNNPTENIILANWMIYADFEGKTTFRWDIPFEGNFEIIALGNKTQLEAKTTISSLIPTPVVFPGNPTCSVVNASTNPVFAHITGDYGFRIDDEYPIGTFRFENSVRPSFPTFLTGGAPIDLNNTVSTTVSLNGAEFGWTSTRPITAVIVRGGGNVNVYPYNPASFSDPGPLTTPSGVIIESVELCFQPAAKITIIKHATPPSTQQFNFTASPGMTPANFSLTDNSSTTDPMQMFFVSTFNLKTIEETGLAGYSLRSINCTVDVGTGGTPTPTRTGNAIEIDIKENDQVTCTFNNDVLTAAGVSVGGMIYNSTGSGLGRAKITVTDSDGHSRSTMSNHFGYYKFEDIEAGKTYFFSINHRKYIFNTRIITVNDSISRLNFSPAKSP